MSRSVPWERVAGAFRHPLGRSGIRRSTVLFLSLFVVLAGLLSYHHVTMAPARATDANTECPPQFIVCVPGDTQRAGNTANQHNSSKASTPSTTAPASRAIPAIPAIPTSPAKPARRK